MKIKTILVFCACGLAAAASLRADTVSDLSVVITANDALRFSVKRIEAHPGQTIHLQLRNIGSMPKQIMGHNWILLRAGSDVAGYASAAIAAKASDYEPGSLAGEVLASTPLIGPRQTADVTFTAPAAPGNYPYLCTFPGHFQAGMQGVLVVH